MKRREFIVSISAAALGAAFIRYMAVLTGKSRPKLCYLPTASADSPTGIITWYRNCAPLNVEPSHPSFCPSTAGSLCWFEEGTTDSRPKELTVVQGLGFLKGSHSPHYDAEPGRRPLYQKLIGSGQLKPGYACDNDAGIYFEDNAVRRVVAARAGAKVYYVSVANGRVVERVIEPEMIS